MTTIREETYRLLRSLGLTTIFGNPGSTELPFLQNFPDDFTYILGLQEASVVAMADGYAQAKRQAAFVNLHTAPGMGNAMGNIIAVWYNKTPLILTAGQQVRAMHLLEPWLYNREAIELPKPYVKWSYEPALAQDVPAALALAYYTAMQQPTGPVFVSLPMDDWDTEARRTRHVRLVAVLPPIRTSWRESPICFIRAPDLLWSWAQALIEQGRGMQLSYWQKERGLACGQPLPQSVWASPRTIHSTRACYPLPLPHLLTS